jgi:PKD domain
MTRPSIRSFANGFVVMLALTACDIKDPTKVSGPPGPTTPQGPQAAPPNVAPVAVAGADQVAECASHTGTAVVLTGSGSSDSDGQLATYEWFEDGWPIATGPTPTVTLALGTHTILLRVRDDDGGMNDDVVIVEIRDTAPPVIALSVTPTTLWPPNHTMHVVARGVSASDVCDPTPTVRITVSSDEPENGLGDGDTAPDWSVLQNGSAFDVSVRAERSGGGDGRVYTLGAVVTDRSGNSAAASGTVSVPHNQ